MCVGLLAFAPRSAMWWVGGIADSFNLKYLSIVHAFREERRPGPQIAGRFPSLYIVFQHGLSISYQLSLATRSKTKQSQSRVLNIDWKWTIFVPSTPPPVGISAVPGCVGVVMKYGDSFPSPAIALPSASRSQRPRPPTGAPAVSQLPSPDIIII